MFLSLVQRWRNRDSVTRDWFEAAEDVCLQAHLLLVATVLPGQNPHLITVGCRGNDAGVTEVQLLQRKALQEP